MSYRKKRMGHIIHNHFRSIFQPGSLFAAAIFCLSARISSNRTVTSRMMATMPIIWLVSSRTGTMVNSSETPFHPFGCLERQGHRPGRTDSPLLP